MMEKFSFKEMLEKYFHYREVSGMKKSSNIDLKYFFNSCQKQYSNCTYLTQEMIDSWWVKKTTESPVSYRSRIYKALPFLRFTIRQMKYVDLLIPPLPKYIESNSLPHFFTYKELTNFFRACDEIQHHKTLEQKIHKIEIPVIFRLLYSSGLRVFEVRMLRRQDVDFNTGEVTIKETKGYIEHLIVLHETILQLLREYDIVMNEIMPSRNILFPDIHDNYHKNKWLSDNFHKYWFKYNDSIAYARELRHHYAIENINSWSNLDYDDVHDKLVALKNSMGHLKISRTLYYYSLTPRYANLIEEKCGESFCQIIPVLP